MRLAMCICVIGLLLGQIAAAPLLRLIRTPEEIFDAAALYLRIYMLGYPFLLLYDFGAACLRARGDSRYPFLALLLKCGAQPAVHGRASHGRCRRCDCDGSFHHALGVSGAASSGKGCSVSLFAILSQRSARNGAWSILKTGIPSAVQGAVFCFANIFVQASVNCLGADAIAGSTIAMNFEYVTYYIITAFGQTATTFTSQNHAAGEFWRCRRILWLCLGLSLLCSTVPFFAIVLFRDTLSGLFTPNAAVIQSAGVRILCILLFEPLCNLYEIPAGVLRDSGHALYPALSTMVGTCAFRIAWIYTVFRAKPTLPMLYHAFPLS